MLVAKMETKLNKLEKNNTISNLAQTGNKIKQIRVTVKQLSNLETKMEMFITRRKCCVEPEVGS